MRARALDDLRLARIRLKRPIRENLPALNLEAMAKVCRLIVEDRDRFPELGNGKGQKRFQFGGPNRERHLKRLESIAKVLLCLIAHMDLVTMRTGRTRSDGSCDAIRVLRPRPTSRDGRPSQTSIQDETGLGARTVVSALRDLRDAGYITAHQPRRDYKIEETGEVRWRSFPTVHTVTLTCLSRLGIDLKWLKDERDKASKRATALPAPIVDIRLRRERQRMIRAQAIAAKRVFRSSAWTENDEAIAASARRRIAERVRKKQ